MSDNQPPPRDDRGSVAGFRVSHPLDGVGQLTLDNPPANALTLSMRRGICDAWAQFEADESVRAVIVASSSERYFSAGLDLTELLDELESKRRSPEELHFMIDRLRWDPGHAGLTKPIVAAIDGYCLAGGFYVAHMCDLRVSSDTAVFGIPEGRWSFPATFAWEIARSIPTNLIAEMLLFPNRRFSAARMYEVGFLNSVVPSSDVLQCALNWAGELAAAPPAAVKAHKRLISETAIPDRDPMRELAASFVRELYYSEEQRKLLQEFVDKRPRGS